MSHGFVELNSKIAYTFFAFTNRKKILHIVKISIQNHNC